MSTFGDVDETLHFLRAAWQESVVNCCCQGEASHGICDTWDPGNADGNDLPGWFWSQTRC